MPAGSVLWYPATDLLAGTDVFGDNTDNTVAWGIKYDHLAFDQFMFKTENGQHWIIFSKSLFTPGNWISGVQTPNIRSSLTPNSPGTSKIYFRSGRGTDPLIAVQD